MAGRGEYLSLEQGRVLKTNRNSLLVLCACIHKETVSNRKRGEKRVKGAKWKGHYNPGEAVGTTCAKLAKEAKPSALQEELEKWTATLTQPLYKEDMTLNVSVLTMTPGQDVQCSREYNTILKMIQNGEKHPGFFFPRKKANFSPKNTGVLDICIQELHYNLLTRDNPNPNYTLPTPLV